MAHSHSSHDTPFLDSSPVLRWILAVVVSFIAIAAVSAMLALWPDAADRPDVQNPYGTQGVSTIDATVTGVEMVDCGGGVGPDDLPAARGDCAVVTASSGDETATFTLDPARSGAGITAGDDIKVIRIAPPGQPPSYEFVDFQRGIPLTALAAIFAVLVVIVARSRGFFALVGIGIALGVMTKFILPAILAGESPLKVAIVGATVIMLAVLYLAHGVSVRTTSALFGTLVGIAMTAAMGVAATDWSRLTGIGSEDDQTLAAIAPNLNLSSVVAATMVIAGLGVLNDVTVTQASAVWEMRGLKSAASRTEVFASAMRIGRDHIASSVYTLVFAYAGSAMTILLLITAYQRGLAEVATTEEIGQEIVRTLVGAIGLVLAVPVTTAFAVWLAPGPDRATEPTSV